MQDRQRTTAEAKYFQIVWTHSLNPPACVPTCAPTYLTRRAGYPKRPPKLTCQQAQKELRLVSSPFLPCDGSTPRRPGATCQAPATDKPHPSSHTGRPGSLRALDDGPSLKARMRCNPIELEHVVPCVSNLEPRTSNFELRGHKLGIDNSKFYFCPYPPSTSSVRLTPSTVPARVPMVSACSPCLLCWTQQLFDHNRDLSVTE